MIIGKILHRTRIERRIEAEFTILIIISTLKLLVRQIALFGNEQIGIEQFTISWIGANGARLLLPHVMYVLMKRFQAISWFYSQQLLSDAEMLIMMDSPSERENSLFIKTGRQRSLLRLPSSILFNSVTFNSNFSPSELLEDKEATPYSELAKLQIKKQISSRLKYLSTRIGDVEQNILALFTDWTHSNCCYSLDKDTLTNMIWEDEIDRNSTFAAPSNFVTIFLFPHFHFFIVLRIFMTVREDWFQLTSLLNCFRFRRNSKLCMPVPIPSHFIFIRICSQDRKLF